MKYLSSAHEICKLLYQPTYGIVAAAAPALSTPDTAAYLSTVSRSFFASAGWLLYRFVFANEAERSRLMTVVACVATPLRSTMVWRCLSILFVFFKQKESYPVGKQ